MMKPYTLSIEINLPRDRVVALFEAPENMKHWQNGFQSFKHLDGEAGRPGARSLIVYQNGRHIIQLTETVIENRLPDAFDGRYEWSGGENTLKNEFVELSGNRTRWNSTCHYNMKSFFLKLMATLMPGTFKKQNWMFMENFKAFAETGASVAAGSSE